MDPTWTNNVVYQKALLADDVGSGWGDPKILSKCPQDAPEVLLRRFQGGPKTHPNARRPCW